MRESFGIITNETLRQVGVDPLVSGLGRFIPGEGVTPAEFVRLPIEQLLDEAQDRLLSTFSSINRGAKTGCDLLLSAGILPARILHLVSVYAAREVLPVFERVYPADSGPRKTIEIKERWLAGRASDQEMAAARTRAWSDFAACEVSDDAARSAAWAARYAAWFNPEHAGDTTWAVDWAAGAGEASLHENVYAYIVDLVLESREKNSLERKKQP